MINYHIFIVEINTILYIYISLYRGRDNRDHLFFFFFFVVPFFWLLFFFSSLRFFFLLRKKNKESCREVKLGRNCFCSTHTSSHHNKPKIFRNYNNSSIRIHFHLNTHICEPKNQNWSTPHPRHHHQAARDEQSPPLCGGV